MTYIYQVARFFCIQILALVLVLACSSFSHAEEPLSGNPWRWSGYIGGSLGKADGAGYSETHLNIKASPVAWFGIFGSGWYRFYNNRDDVFGGDIGGEFSHFLEVTEHLVLGGFLQTGYRFASDNNHAPFVGTGLQLSVGPLNVNVGYRIFLHELVGSDIDSDSQFYVNFSGGFGLGR